MDATQLQRSRRYRKRLVNARDRLASIEADLRELHKATEAFLGALERVLALGLSSGSDTGSASQRPS